MDEYFKKNLKETLARRAMLSMRGKAIIGTIGGVVLLLLGWFRSCNVRDDIKLETANEEWFNFHVLDLQMLIDSNRHFEFFTNLGIAPNAVDSVAGFMASRNDGGTNATELNAKQVDSINSRYSVLIPSSQNNWVFYVECYEQQDYIVIMQDSLIKEIIDIPEEK